MKNKAGTPEGHPLSALRFLKTRNKMEHDCELLKWFLIMLIVLNIVFICLNFYANKEYFVLDSDTVYLNEVKKKVYLIDPSFANIPILPGNESVTVNKKDVFICLKDPITLQYYSQDVLVYVLLHEISHVLSKSYSLNKHNEEFSKNFNILLNKAISIGIMSPNINIPSNYCSLNKTATIKSFIKKWF